MRKSYLLALTIAVIAMGWVLSGEFGGQAGSADGGSAPGNRAHLPAKMPSGSGFGTR